MRKILLDTCTFLWIAAEASELSKEARILFADSNNEVYLSAVSTWEIAVKYGLGKLPLPDSPEIFVREQRKLHQIESLSLDEASSLHLPRLPILHRDPFDRMLICQAIEHDLVILTPDLLIRQYSIKTIW
jgi:PIN domain nuclease of toxin-antitoxin system